jgi:hypothetical protein
MEELTRFEGIDLTNSAPRIRGWIAVSFYFWVGKPTLIVPKLLPFGANHAAVHDLHCEMGAEVKSRI